LRVPVLSGLSWQRTRNNRRRSLREFDSRILEPGGLIVEPKSWQLRGDELYLQT